MDDEALVATGGPEHLVGLLVEIDGAPRKITPLPSENSPPSTKPIEVNGRQGRCVEWRDAEDKYVVHLFCGFFVKLEAGCVKEWQPPPPQDGGFDLAWPSGMPDGPADVEALPVLANLLSEILLERGWCLLQMTADDELREDAVHQAGNLNFTVPRAELLTDYLGHDGVGKMSYLEHSGNEDTLTDGSFPWGLSEYDRELTDLARAMALISEETLDFQCAGRRKGLVMMPFKNYEEEDRYVPESITDEDVEGGILESHIKFIRHRKLCFMYWVDNEGGELSLHPRPDLFPNEASVKLPLSPNKLLVFRSDLMNYTYEPEGGENGRAVALTTWLMAKDGVNEGTLQKARMNVKNDDMYSESLGTMIGPPMPMGYRIHVMSIHAHHAGNANSAEEGQIMFAAGTDGFQKIPIERFDTDLYCYDMGDTHTDFGRSYVCHSAMFPTNDLIMFDNTFFGISSEEARFLSPNSRLVLMDGYVSLMKTGLTRYQLYGRPTSVFLGTTGSDFEVMATARCANTFHPNAIPGTCFGYVEASPFMQSNTNMMTAGRLSHILGLTGGVTAIDTACSASLVGVSAAASTLRRTDSHQNAITLDRRNADCICMGINTVTSPGSFIGLCGATMLAKDGRCFTFDNSAQGYARGEGYGSVHLIGSDSADDNMTQLACLMGCQINQDGRSATLTAPNGMAQRQCIAESMREAGVVASQITMAECHGTGTALGDPIEVGALRGAMEPRPTPLFTTSAKSNIGHLEPSAGITGLLKCIDMVSSSKGHANIHLAELNPHLDTDGFPAVFESEHVDSDLNSNYAGVSSFGFSGTNARADVWSQCKGGPHKMGKLNEGAISMETLDQIHTICPITLGPIEYLTGEAVTSSFSSKKKYKADVLREEWAPYDISSVAYEGEYRYRREPPLDETEEDLVKTSAIYICGSWSGYTRQEAMVRQGGGWYTATVEVGETRCEFFSLCINEESKYQAIYPSVTNAAQHIWIEGPDEKANGRKWMIDGRDEEVPAGTRYEISFRWHPERCEISWDPCGDQKLTDPRAPFEHNYFLTGTFGTGYVAMGCIAGQPGLWEGRFRMSLTGEDEFQIARDKDPLQMIYPAVNRTARAGVPARGPDCFGEGKRWLVRGLLNDIVTVKLHIVDAELSVTVCSEAKGSMTWEGAMGWDRHDYAVVGSWTDWDPVAMTMDAEEPGLFRAFGKVRGSPDEWGPFAESFQIIIDEDRNFSYHPEADGAGSGEAIVFGPDRDGTDVNWLITSPDANRRFEIVLDLRPDTKDRRRMVTWSIM